MPALEDTQVLIVALFLFMILLLYALDASSGPLYGFFGAIVGLSFGFYIETLTSNLIISTAIVATFLVLFVRTIGELIDARSEVIR